MPCHISDTKLDPREVYEDTPTATEADEYNGGYIDDEQAAYYAADPNTPHKGYGNCCTCPACGARDVAIGVA